MSKVILTQKQARMFENHKYAVEELLEKRVCDNCPTSIDDMPIDDVVKAIVYGYEVEPEFNVGDWVHNNVTGRVAKIDDRGYDEEVAWVDDDKVNFFTQFRHATPEEIAEEKERRWWAKHGRDPWELEDRDLLIDSTGEIYTVWIGDNEFDLTSNGDVVLSVCDPKILRNSFEVLCFAENRLDVKAERVQELEKERSEWKDTAQSYYMANQELREQNKRYREALEEILAEAYEEAGVHPDTGMQLETFIAKKARKTLEGEK